MVDVISSGRNDVIHVDLTPMRGNEVEAMPAQAKTKVKERIGDLTVRLSTTTAGQPGLDALTLLDRAARYTSPGDSIILETSGIQTVDPLDLRTLGWQFNPERVVTDLVSKEVIPDLSGRQVMFAGLGSAMGTQPPLPRPAHVQVEKLWLAICAAGNAKSCSLAAKPLELTAPVATNSVPVVPVESVSTTCAARMMSVPAAAAFAGDSAALLDGADRALTPIARALRQCPQGSTASIVGHAADPTPGVVDALQLSDQRAEAVRVRLIALGAPHTVFTDVRGVGDTEPKVDNWINGEFSEPLAALNRRVDVSIQPAR